MSFASKIKLRNLSKERRVFYLILGLVLLLVLFFSFYIIYKQNQNAVNRFNQQSESLAKTSTTYLASNYALYGSPPTIKFQNIVNDFINQSSGVCKFQIFDTEGLIVFDSGNMGKPDIGKVSENTLSSSRTDKITTVMDGNKIDVLVSPYFEEWGVHKYSVLFYPSYATVNADNLQFTIESGAIIVLLIITMMMIVSLFALNERFKAHKEERERLEALDKQREGFMMLVAHNLRTPLTIMQGFLSLMKESKISKEQRKLVEPIDVATADLNKLVENIITITAVLGQQNLPVLKESIRLSEFVPGILSDYHEKIVMKKLSINQEWVPADLTVFGNKQYTKLIFSALISNAIKFNKDGGNIRLHGWIEGENTVVSFTDTGVGISENDKEQIFSEFHKGGYDEGKFVYNYEGTGLGLYTSKILVEFMGGKIWFVSEDENGTTFYISLPTRGITPILSEKGSNLERVAAEIKE